MTIERLLERARQIWGPPPHRPDVAQHIIIPMGVVYGDMCRWQRDNADSFSPAFPEELKKELGNMILSTIRWCDDLGFDAEDCINRAIHCQELFRASKRQ